MKHKLDPVIFRHGVRYCRQRDLDPTRKIGIAVNEARKKAREEAAIAKAAGFEWVNVSAP